MNQKPLTREAVAHLEIGHTNMPPAVARAMVAAFLVFICAVALFEISSAVSGDEASRAPWQRLGRIPADVSSAEGLFARNRRVLEGLHEFETTLEDGASVGQLLRPPIQRFVSGTLGGGNEQVYIGRDGWLFYRPDVEYVTSRGFLAEDVRERRIRIADEWTTPPQPDPREAIRRFKQDLDARGIALIVMPVPVKPTIHPEMLASNFEGRTDAPQNPDHQALVAGLRAEGIMVLDATEMLVQARASGASQYLATDTHWRPEAMEIVAERLATLISSTGRLSAGSDTEYRADTVDLAHRGDIFAMLDLQDGAGRYQPEQVTVRRVSQPDGSPWRSSPDADVLVLGDSFANIFSLESMGWGTGGGLVEQLSFLLRRPVDRLVQNDAGAYATREMLAREGPSRLAGKKVVVWQFAARELAFGDWKVLPLQ